MAPKRRNPPTKLSAAAEVAGSVNLIGEILVRLPVKSLIKFELVSKQWQGLICDPQFARAHTRLNPNKSPSGFFFYDSRCATISLKSVPLNQTISNQIVSIPSLDEFLYLARLIVAQSCNGLLLCYSACVSYPEKYYILNPTTGKCKELPQPEDNGTKPSITFGSLAYDPSASGNYKVVLVCCFDKRRIKSQIYVYSSEDSSWRNVAQNLQPNWLVDIEYGTYWNGAIHWASSRGKSLRFDVNSERLEHYRMPRSAFAYSRYFGQSRDRLHIVTISHAHAQRFSVYELRRDEGWNILFTISVQHLVYAVWKMGITSGEGKVFPFSVICVIAGEVELDSELVLRIPEKVISYNHWKKTARVLLDLPDETSEPLKSRFECVYPFIATLAPV